MGQSLVLAGQTITPSVLNRIYGQADTTSHTVNGTASAALSSTYSIPAGDALTGTAYRLTTFGNGTWGGTGASLIIANNFAGTNIGTTPEINGTTFGSGASVDFEMEVKVICVSTGTSGTWRGSVKGTISESANPELPGTAADNTISFSGVTHTAVTQDTTVSDALAVFASYTTTQGTPSLTCVGTLFEKVN